MEYYFNNLNPSQFQRLINTILTARFGEDARLTPLRGQDGGRDGETAPNNPNFEYQVKSIPPTNPAILPPKPGRYLFQVKHHSTIDIRISDARQSVISDFKSEFKRNVIGRTGDEKVNYFFLVTNVPSSRDSLVKLDQIRSKLLEGYSNLHTDIWWQEQLIAFLDQMPNIWSSFPDMFAGGKVPFITSVVADDSTQLPRAVKLAISKQYQRDGKIKFRQINLQTDLSKLFTDLDATLEELDSTKSGFFLNAEIRRLKQINILYSNSSTVADTELEFEYQFRIRRRDRSVSALGALLLEGEVPLDEKERENPAKKLILEGGPGQGKSTITQMTAQIYREQILKKTYMEPEGRWIAPQKSRIPFRVELRVFAEEITQNPEFSVEQFIALAISKDSGGATVNVDDIHTIVEGSPILLIFDGLDEVGSDDLRDDTISKILECVDRFENDLSSDLRVIITTRPPAISGRRERFSSFSRIRIASLNEERINSYLGRWLSVQLHDDEDERTRVADSFNKRRHEYLIEPLVRNPMQLSVLLHFIHIQGDAFPDRRAELYKEYFETVIKRDVEKSPQLRERRRTVEALHQYLAYIASAMKEKIFYAAA